MTLNPRHRRAKPRWLLALGAIAALTLLVAGMVLAVHDEGFQLDGNTLKDDLTTGYPNPDSTLSGAFAGPYDWDSLFDSTGAKRDPLPPGFLDATFLKDFGTKQKGQNTVFDTSDGTTFTTGSKDILNINEWRCVGANNVTDKGDIMNAYATVFRNDAGDRILYFGLEKYIDNGSNNVGFWFLADGSFGCQEGGTGNGNAFVGEHHDGDALIVSEFTKGGGVSTIKAYRWNRPDPSQPGSLSSDPVEVGVDCVRGADADTTYDTCATTNILDQTPIWPHASKTTGLNNSYPPATFFEGGIKLTGTVFQNSCFNSFLADTRSSQETTATLYDYASGELAACGSLKVVKVTGPDTTDPQDFSFTTTEPAGNDNIDDAFTLDTDPADGTPDTNPDQVTWSAVPPGTYTITEADASASGWYLNDISCTKNGEAFTLADGSTDTSSGVATVEMGFGDNVVCTYTNYKPSAYLDITGDGTNEIGNDHQFTVTAYANDGDGSANHPASGVNVTVALTDANGADTSAATNTCTTAADGTCSVTINSATSGTTTGTASATISVHGVDVAVDTTTDATIAANQSVLKTWVDAKVTIGESATNAVGDDHTVTGTAYVDYGDGLGFVTAPNGTTINFNIESGPGSLSASSCAVDGGDGNCTVTLTSNATGVTVVSASFTISVDGASMTRTTGTGAPNSVNLTKTWVDAAIDITNDGTNRVGDDHDFIVTTYADTGDGNAFVKVGGVDVTVALVDAHGADTGPATATCATEANDQDPDFGTCAVTISSDTTGTTTGTASATITVGGLDIAVDSSTDYTVPANASVLKTWVDARIGISGTDTNGIGEPHTFTVTVEKDLGDGAGFVPAADEQVDVTLVDALGASHELDEGQTTCDVPGDAFDGTGTDSNGQCVVVFTSNTAGTVTGSASSMLTVSGVPMTVSTSDTNASSGPSVIKTFVDGTLVWHKNDNHGNRLAGATFQVCRTTSYNSMTDSQDDTADVCWSVTDNNTAPGAGEKADEDPADGDFELSGLVLGTYTVRETAAPTGYYIDNPDAVSAGAMTTSSTTLEITDPFVNSKAFRLIVLTCDDISKELVVSSVDLDGDGKDTLDASDLANLGWFKSDGNGGYVPLTEADLCALPGASYGSLDEGTYTPAVTIPKNVPTP